MREWLINNFHREDIDEKMKIFNIVHSICVISMFLINFIISYFLDDERAIYITFCVCILLLLTIFQANRTGNIRRPIILMSIVFNIIYLPAMYFLYNRFVCVIPLYFLAGLVYTVLLLDVKTGVFLSLVEFVYYFIIIIYSYFHYEVNSIDLSQEEVFKRYFAAIVGVLIAGICTGAAVRFRYLYYRKISQRAEELKSEAVEAYIAKDMFLINMSHEIRTPMNAIVGTVELLLEQNISEQVSDSVYNILNSCNALLSITDEIMDLSKSESGELEIFETNYSLNEMLMEVINMMAIRLNESKVSFYIDINKNIPKNLVGDASKIRQLFVNLLNNAAKFTEKGKIILRVDYKRLPGDSIELIVDVEDTGSGIKEEILPGIFTRIREADKDNQDENTGKEENMGFGLAVCSEIVEKMGGSISVQSELNVGSIFTFKVPQKIGGLETIAYLPDAQNYYCLIYEKDDEHSLNTHNLLKEFGIKCDVARTIQDFERFMSVNGYSHVFIDNNLDECNNYLDNSLITSKIVSLLTCDDNINIKKAKTVLNRPINIINLISLFKNETNNYVRDVVKKGRFTCPKASILVVDDNFTNLNVASAILKKYGAQIYNASSGKDCLRLVETTNIDIIFLDYMMPEMNGIDTLEAIRKIPGSRFAALPVIALTANVISGAREMFLEAGFDDFMAKPISIEKMEKIIKRYLPSDYIEYTDIME